MVSISILGRTLLVDEDIINILRRQHKPRKTRKYPVPLSLDKDGYAVYAGKLRCKLHHVVVGKPRKGYVVDHINGNRLDNRRCNLRVITHRENCQNRKDNNKYVGVRWSNHKRKYVAEINIAGDVVHLGCFSNPQEASGEYREACRRYGQNGNLKRLRRL